jgi:outer membrane protein assembly factor BamE (lipoprotein component of BamABCDE complex)
MWYRTILFTGVILISCSLSGCLILPTNYYKDYSRKNVDEESPTDIVLGVTTREKVLLTLGEPDRVYEDGSEFWYIATKVKLIWGVYGGSGGEVRKTYNHVFRFDKNGLVETLRLNDKGALRKPP